MQNQQAKGVTGNEENIHRACGGAVGDAPQPPDATWYATHIASAGVHFEGYNDALLTKTPTAYLVPVGEDRMRSVGDSDTVLSWMVVDQTIPAPYAIGSTQLDDPDWTPLYDGTTGGNDLGTRIRRHPSFRAYYGANGAAPNDAELDCTRLVGRSAWNTRWLLIIPAWQTMTFGGKYGILISAMDTSRRSAFIERKTKETDISLSLDLDGTGAGEIDTGIGFFNHMLELFKKHALVDLTVKCAGDLDVDYHHTVEDVGLVLGQALNKALGERRGIVRYGFASIPMDEALCETSLDLGGRPFLVMACPMKHLMVRDFEVKLIEEFFRAVSVEGRLNIHLRQIYGDEAHHVCEGFFKSFARALRQAVAADPRETGVPSSKGCI